VTHKAIFGDHDVKGDEAMKMRQLTQLPGMAMTVLCLLLLGQGLVVGHDHSEGPQADRIEGVWDVKEEILNGCPTGDTVRIVPNMNMFIHGGQLLETPGGSSVGAPPLKRSTPGLGTWQHLGKRHYAIVFRFFWFNGTRLPTQYPCNNLYIEVGVSLEADGH